MYYCWIVTQTGMWVNWVFWSTIQCLLTCQNVGEEQSTLMLCLMYVKRVNVICFVWSQPAFLRLPANEQMLALTSQVNLFHTSKYSTHAHRTYLPWVQRHFANAWFCDFPGCFDSSCSNRDFHLHTCEHTKISSHPLTFTDEDTQIRINTHQCVGPHTHTAYEYTHIHTLINSYIPCIQNILEIGSYKHTDRFSEDLYHIPQCVQVKLEYC